MNATDANGHATDAPATAPPLDHRLAVIVPCYNAGARLRPVLDALLPLGPRVLLVDDGSTDGATLDTAAWLEERGGTVLRHDANRGKGHALLTGFRHALEDPAVEAVAVIDADGQHDAAELPRLAAAQRDDHAALVIGSRVFDGGTVPLRSRFGNRCTILLTRLLLGRRLPDTQCGFRVLSRAYAREVCDTVAPGRYETEMEILVRAVLRKHRLVFVPIATRYEPGNPSSHFHKLRDSALIYTRLFRSLRRR